MSSMFKKKGGLAFKPKAPPPRRTAAAAAPAAPSADRLSRTPAPTALPTAPPAVPPAGTSDAPSPSTASAPHEPPPTPPPTAPAETHAPHAHTPRAPSVAARTRRSQGQAAAPETDTADRRAPEIAAAAAATPYQDQAALATPPPTQTSRARSLRSTAAAATTALAERESVEAPQESPSHLSQLPQAASTRGRMAISSLLQSDGHAATTQVAEEPPTTRRATRSQNSTAREMRISSIIDSSNPQANAEAAAPAVSAVPAAQPVDPALLVPAASPAASAPQSTRARRGRSRASNQEPPNAASSVEETASGALAAFAAFAAASAASTAASAAPKKRRYTKRKQTSEAAAVEAATEPSVDGEADARGQQATAPIEGAAGGAAAAVATASKRARRERSVTPDDAETRTVDHRELKMEDLTKDLRIGKKFSRHDELVDRLREKRRKYRRDRQLGKQGLAAGTTSDAAAVGLAGPAGGTASLPSQGLDGTSGGGGSSLSSSPSLLPSPLPSGGAIKGKAAAAGPQFEIIDGAIVVNQASLVHDRHALAAAEQGELEEVEENDFTRQTTSNTYLKPGKLRGPNAWTDAETELFYRALSMFGTSFDLICRWFPGKSRRHIKMKFNREDKLRPARITEALVGQNKVAIDVDEYMARTGQTLHATETIASEYAEREAVHEAEQQRIVDEQAEALRKKREALFGPRSGLGGDASAHEGSAAGAGAGAGAAAQQPGGGDDGDMEEVVDETDLPPPRRQRNGGRNRIGG